MLTLEIIPYREIEKLSSVGRIRKLLNIAKSDSIVLLEGRLKKEEETELIQATMEEINEDFKGIELAVIEPTSEDDMWYQKIKNSIVNILAGNRMGFTVIGPASVVKEIKKDPSKIQLLTQEKRVLKKKKSARKSRRRKKR